ncbi:Disulfide-bond oxidoreductase YghU [Diplonema papillatum]|nr:Disulfide-bond oxidoreductase YghU [Diplonema papillatum]
MSGDSAPWQPPATISAMYEKMGDQKFSGINRPTSGARDERELEVGSAPLQLYSLGTPNGQKVSLLLEELGASYDAHYVNIMKCDQFTAGFVAVNPNSKIPALVDKDGPGGKPINLWESGSILVYLAEKHNKFIPTDPALRVETMNWLFWQMAGQGPMSGNFGHFFAYAPADKHEARNYGVARYGMETQRLCHVLDTHLAGREFIVGGDYTIADMCCFPWADGLFKGGYKCNGVTCAEFLEVEQYKNLKAWVDRIRARPATEKAMTVCTNGVGKPWLAEK